MHGMPKKYDAATKERAVRMVQEQLPEYGGSLTKACAAVGARLSLPKDTVRGWCRRELGDAPSGEALTTAEREEIKALKAKVRRLEEDNAILQSAATFFAGALDPRSR
jgi:transposase-like protein